jgi:small subunit ribosomal protein S17
MSIERGFGRTLRGTVVSNKADKSVTVKVVRTVRHPKYNKFIKRMSKHYAHDERNEASIGDVVEIVESRPLSALKRWRLQKIVDRAPII